MSNKILWSEIKNSGLHPRIQRHVNFWLKTMRCMKADVVRALFALNFAEYAIIKIVSLTNTSVARQYYNHPEWKRRETIILIMKDVLEELKETDLYERVKKFDEESKEKLQLRRR